MTTALGRRAALTRGIDARAAAGVALFWASSIAVGASTFLVLALLSPHLASGGLAAVSAVLGLSYVLAVPPGAIQLRAAAAAGMPGATLSLRPPRLIIGLAGGLLAVSPLLAHALKVPTVAVALAALQLPLSCALGSLRGTLVGRRRLHRAGATFGIDAGCRLLAGTALGIAWGAAGVAAALVLSALVPLLILRRACDGPRSSVVGGSNLGYMAAVSVITLLTNVDVLLAPRVLGASADAYAAAALPAKGIFFALFTVSWLAVSSARAACSTRQLLTPAAATLTLGLAGAGALVLARPLLPALFKHGEPSLLVLGSLALAMAVAGATAVVVSMAVARGARRPWAMALVAVLALAVTTLTVEPDQAQLALGVLLAQLLALAGAVRGLLDRRGPATGSGAVSGADMALASSSPPAPGLRDRLRARRSRARSAPEPPPREPSAERAPDPGRESEPAPEPDPERAPDPGRESEPAPEPDPERAPDPGRESEPDPGRAPAGPDEEPGRFPTGVLLVACVLIGIACFLQAPGHIIADTKLDLFVDPGRFLARALHLWDPTASFGQVQNQAVGYLFPMGAFFDAVAHIGAPIWIAQRLWLTLLLSLAVWGTARVAAALRIGTPAGWALGGLAYGLSPFFVGQIASTSAAVLPAALAPWALLPLINAPRSGSLRGAAGRSGLVVFAMGGVNAASTLGVLPLPVLYLLTRRRSPARRTLSLWWVVAVALACAWWAVALVFQGHWGLDFIHFTETSATTQSTTSALEALRGTAGWVAYLHLGQAWLPAGWTLATAPVVVATTAGAAAAGLAGLARRGLPERRFLIASLGFGVLCVGAGYIGPGAGLGGSAIQSLLSGALAAFRNTDKFEPVLRLPLALGVVYLVSRMPAVGRASAGRLRLASFIVALALVLVGALPFAQGQLATQGSFKAVPAYWYRLADYMRAHSARSRVLLLPSSAFAEYRWGRPLDEPLQTLATTPWAVRSLLPLGGTASTQLLDAIEGEIVDGQVSPHLDEVLARAGISYVVARNDLDWQRTDSPAPAQVLSSLRAAGLAPVASFGPTVPSEQGVTELELPQSQARVPSLEVFAVPGGASLVNTYPQAGALALSGGPPSLLQLADRGELGSRAVVLASDLPGKRLAAGDRWVVSDASRRDAQDFGLVESNYSYTLQAKGLAPGTSPSQIVPTAPGERQAVAVYRGDIAGVTASSYGSWLLQIPELAPANAFDGDPATAWVAGRVDTSVGQWVQADLTAPKPVSTVQVQLLEDGPWRPRVNRITVTTQAGSLTSTVSPTQALQTVPTRSGQTSFVRVTFAGVTGQTRGGATAGLRDVLIPGVSATRYIQPPQEPALLQDSAAGASMPSFALTRLTADPTDLLRRDPETQLARVIQMPRAAPMTITGTVLPTAGTGLDGLLTRTRGLAVTASSSLGDLPRWRPGNAIDGSPRTAWIAAPPGALPANYPSAPGVAGPGQVNRPQRVSPVPAVADPNPTLSLSWPHPRTLTAVRVVPAGPNAAAPTELRLASPVGDRLVRVAPDGGLVHFPALHTAQLTVTFPGVAVRYTSGAGGARVRLPVGLTELDFPALRSLQVISLPPGLKLHVPCRQGPILSINGRPLHTSLATTAGSIVAQQPIAFSLCTSGQRVSLPAGSDWILSPGGGPFTVTQMTISPSTPGPGPVARPRSADRLRWGADARQLRLSAGPATYLAVAENFNAGWTATMNGHRLRTIRLDGWEQGFMVPSGAAGTVNLSFAPDSAYRLALLVGAAFVLLLLGLALVPARPRGRAAGFDEVAAPAIAGRYFKFIAAAGLVVAVGLISWPVLLALVPLAVLARTRPRLLAPLAGLAMLAAGVLVAVHVVPFPSEHSGSFSVGAEILATLAFAAVGVTLLGGDFDQPRSGGADAQRSGTATTDIERK